MAEFDCTQLAGALQNRVEDGLQSSRRCADDAQDFRRSHLLFERLLQLARTRLNFLEQSDVLDRDHRLIREGLDELDLVCGEGPNGASSKRDHADRLSLPHERHPEQRAEMAEALRLIPAIVWIPIHILNLNALAFEQGRPATFPRSGSTGMVRTYSTNSGCKP